MVARTSGSAWHAPNDAGVLPFDVLLLISAARYWVAWWVDDSADRRIEIDVCLLPVRGDDGWSYVDLELDPVRHDDGLVEIQDRDEFDTARRHGWISTSDGEIAEATASELEDELRRRHAPFGEEGWERIERLRDTP